MRNSAIINLTTLKNNAKNIKSALPKSTKFCAVVKANAYGHGAPEVASALYDTVDCFAVSIIEEAVQLRLAGIDKDVLVLVPVNANEIEIAINKNITLTIDSLKTVRAINKVCKKLDAKVKVHIKYNTGMNRFGIDDLDQLDKICKYISKSPFIILEGIYSHLACPENERAFNSAYNKFLLAINKTKVYNKKVIVHLSASGGFLKGAFFDMVRIGILLYGYKPFKSNAVTVKPVMKVFSQIIKRRKVGAGDSVMYGNKRLKKELSGVIVRSGYADGFARKRINNLANNRCMDVSMYQENGAKDIFPVLADADEIAKQTGTISYEVLCTSTLRANKIYKR